MRQQVVTLMLLLVTILQCYAQSLGPSLEDGVVTYFADDGQKKEIQIGKKCADLWVSPDESVIAFITLDKTKPPDTEIGYLVESTICIARKSDNFKPVPIALKPIYIRGERWKVVRQPSLLPDLKTLYFLVPSYMTSWTLISTQLQSGANKTITHSVGNGYCIIWKGKYSGDLLLNLRSSTADGVITYPCFLRRKGGKLSKVADDNECFDFDEFAPQWNQKHHGTCRQGELTEIR